MIISQLIFWVVLLIQIFYNLLDFSHRDTVLLLKKHFSFDVEITYTSEDFSNIILFYFIFVFDFMRQGLFM